MYEQRCTRILEHLHVDVSLAHSNDGINNVDNGQLIRPFAQHDVRETCTRLEFLCQSHVHHPNLALGRPICRCLIENAHTVAEARAKIATSLRLATPANTCTACVVNKQAWAEFVLDPALWRIKAATLVCPTADHVAVQPLIDARLEQLMTDDSMAAQRTVLLVTGAFSDVTLVRLAIDVNVAMLNMTLQLVGRTSFRCHRSLLLRCRSPWLQHLMADSTHDPAVHITGGGSPATWGRILRHIYTAAPPSLPLPIDDAVDLAVHARRVGLSSLYVSVVTSLGRRCTPGTVAQLAVAALQCGDLKLLQSAIAYMLSRLPRVRASPGWGVMMQCPTLMAILRAYIRKVMRRQQQPALVKPPPLQGLQDRGQSASSLMLPHT